MSPALHATQLHILHSAHSLPLVARWSVAFAVTVTKWDNNRRSRTQLKRLPAHLLHDIGLDRVTARTEASKPFWQD
ncbi:protein of unknown function [Octadecabacter temperatus]|uniref:YjiS-like domain-containing protein n=1 Tax=Octadecabacter temperatus TaxID=1458307 RepID=A0A0K0Y574_9RHOB|nr:DUF1127 domain-containing protein [Octadecabacter temperatus]AKS46095.1 hypothetical protein OSB_15440 [Octadecabacter temperatus]SIO07389.1 protein of unknown function [Octadecabacter temperatus]